MSYDHYIAVFKPLHYMTITNHRVCTLLVLASSLASFFITFPLLMFSLQLDYCKSNVIEHYTCNFPPILQFSCSDTKFLEIMVFSCAVFTLIFTLALIILSYTHIIRTISEDPFHHSEDKGLFHMFIPHDCHLHLLWKLHFHVHESISKGQGLFEQGSSCAKYLCSPHAKLIYLYLKELTSQESFHGYSKEECNFLKEMKI